VASPGPFRAEGGAEGGEGPRAGNGFPAPEPCRAVGRWTPCTANRCRRRSRRSPSATAWALQPAARSRGSGLAAGDDLDLVGAALGCLAAICAARRSRAWPRWLPFPARSGRACQNIALQNGRRAGRSGTTQCSLWHGGRVSPGHHRSLAIAIGPSRRVEGTACCWRHEQFGLASKSPARCCFSSAPARYERLARG